MMINKKGKTCLQQHQTERVSDGRPPFAPRTHHNKQFSQQDLLYLAKIKNLSKLSEKYRKNNQKIQYRIHCVEKEIKLMKRSKRFLCEKLLEGHQNIHGQRIDFDENDNEAQIDETVNEVVQMVLHNPNAAELMKKKKIAEPKKREYSEAFMGSEDDIDRSRQHIISIIESVASEGSSGSESPKKKHKSSSPSVNRTAKPTQFNQGQRIAPSTSANNTYVQRPYEAPQEEKPNLLRVNYNQPPRSQEPEQPQQNYDAMSTPLREVLKIAQGRKADHGGVAEAWLSLIQTSSMSPRTNTLSPTTTSMARSRLNTSNSISSTNSNDLSNELPSQRRND